MVNPAQALKELAEQQGKKTRECAINEWIEYLDATDPAKLEEPAQDTAPKPYTEKSRMNNRNEESNRYRQE